MKKGFTLIELLAVIVILAIIALIATPIILGIINDAKEDSEKRSVENYAHAVELAIARDATKKGGVIEPGDYTISNVGKKVTSPLGKEITIDYKGEAIKTGSLKVLSDGKIELSEISFNGKTSYNYSEALGVTKAESGGNSASSAFKVSSNGVLMHYERQGNETSVVVPAEVNGIKITGILQDAFLPGDYIYYEEDEMFIGLTAEAISKRDYFEGLGYNFASIDEFGKGNDPIAISAILNKNSSGCAESIAKGFYIDGDLDWSEDHLSNYYLENLDLSNMTYLEVIGDFAFYGLSEWDSNMCADYDSCVQRSPLKSVKLPMNGNLKTIGEKAFESNQISEIILPSTLQTIGSNSFVENQLSEVIIPSSVTTIEQYAFSDNPLTKIIVKRVNSDGMILEDGWQGPAEVVYDPS